MTRCDPLPTAATGIGSCPPAAEAVRAGFAAQVPIGRMGTAAEVAAVVAFLASDQSTFVVGTTIYVDGGEKQF